jgi:tRNA G18 (ribose-2'-O)-methylase SpoU
MNGKPITLVGDGIENPWNAQTMIHAARMFGGECLFRDRHGLANTWQETPSLAEELRLISPADLAARYSPIVALDNLDGAAVVHGFRLGPGRQPAVVAGNERTGIARDIQSMATDAVQIPMVSRRLNCLNVAAASAVALYYLSRGSGGTLQIRSNPDQRRPELLMMGASEHVELGSSIRSAGAFGWSRLLVEDRTGVWFGGDRATQSEARAAARRQRNPIHLIPTPPDQRYRFEEVCVITVRRTDTPIHRANLARGAQQVIAIPDESALDLEREEWDRLGRAVKFVHLDLPCGDFTYHYRLIATIALAEVARQVGQRARPAPARPRRAGPLYDSSLKLLMEERGEVVYLEDLEGY